MDGNARFQEEILAQLAGIIDRQVLQMVEAAVGSVLRNYEVTRKETALSTNIVEFPELDLFLGRLRYRNCSEGTIKQYRTTILGFLVYVGKPVTEITDTDIRSFLDEYERIRQIKKRTKDGKRRILSSFFTYLLNNGHLPRGNPMVRVEAIEYTKTVRQALTAREVEKLRIACGSNIRDNVLLELFLATGCRVSEVVHMRIEDIDLKEECIRVLGKGDKERIVFLGARAIEFLEQYLGDRKSGQLLYRFERRIRELGRTPWKMLLEKLQHKRE